VAWDWSAEQLRLSLFSSAPVSVSEADWQRLTGQETSENRKIFPGGVAYSGNINASHFQVTGSVSRIDVVCTALLPTEANDHPKLPVIGDWQKALDGFVSVTTEWLQTRTDPLIRVAFGASLLLPTESHLETLRELKGLLTSVDISEGMREPSFRVNWPRNSSIVPGMPINRITNWLTVQLILQLVQVQSSSLSTQAPHQVLHAVKLELDHSTDERRTVAFERGEVIPIYQELLDLASENALKGEQQ
jgi:hypothetical protein